MRNHFKGNASHYESLDSFTFGMEDEIKKYDQISSDNGRNKARSILKEEFINSRKIYPILYPADKVIIGMSSEQFYQAVPKPPINTSTVHIPSTPPTSFTVNEYTFILPKEYNVSGKQPIWVAFLDGKVVRAGFGTVKHAEYEGYQWYLNEDVAAGRLKQAEAMRILYEKYKQVYGQPSAMLHEHMTYTIMIS